MVHCEDAHVLDIASYCYVALGLKEDVFVEVMPLEVHGYCYSDGDVEISDKLEGKELGIAICHELTHCAQFEANGVSNEEEAYRLEEVLYEEYINEKNN
jgi:hypothetical protein